MVGVYYPAYWEVTLLPLLSGVPKTRKTGKTHLSFHK